ncbi:hypothetical protein EDB92DRAFT_1940577 [Lactarius akahatsu]|uniref:Uncharacterized protein n=1 Tax=Lactarius akahatsu TaxID=416441 RepID=A0AAD4QCA6_9AGAM|nr:hypothetical protein EDB92DRAFT_1940577 [Lactarius akahatsu]
MSYPYQPHDNPFPLTFSPAPALGAQDANSQSLNDETTGNPGELPTSSSPDPQPPSDFPSSFSTSEFQLTPAYSGVDVQPETEPASMSLDILSSFPASPSDSESACSATDDQLEPVSLSLVSPAPPSSFHTPLLAPVAAEVPEIAPFSPTEPPANLAPLPSAFPVLPASCDLPPATLSPLLISDPCTLSGSKDNQIWTAVDKIYRTYVD